MFSNDIQERDGSEHKMMTRTLFTLKHLEPCRVRMSEKWHAQREKMCVCARPVKCTVYTPPSRQGQLPLSEREIQKKDNYKSTAVASQLLKICQQYDMTAVEIVLNQFPGGWIDFFENVSRCCLILPLFTPRTVFPFVLMPVPSPGGRGPPG